VNFLEQLRWDWRVRQDRDASPYKVFTTAFDRVVEAEDLDRELGRADAKVAAALAADRASFEALEQRAHQVAEAALETLRSRAALPVEGTVVSLLLDQSGSMRGAQMLAAALAIEAARRFLDLAGCRTEVLGFTTRSWRGGESRKAWQAAGRSRRPGRLCDLLHIVYQAAAEGTGLTGLPSLIPMLRSDLLKENVDGEALKWAAGRLRALPASRRILLILSDGAPVDDSTLTDNSPRILERHVRQVISELEGSSDIELLALGIGFDVSRYYAAAHVETESTRLPITVMEILLESLARPVPDRQAI
jgi:cobaltochelatase CobT